MNLTALIIDDEFHCRETLNDLILRYCSQITKVYSAQNIKEGLQAIQEFKPSILFLDISMPDGTGFDLLSQLGNHQCKIIFTTAYDDYAVKAFRYSAIDYLMKPINISELREAVAKCTHENHVEPKVEAIQYYLKNKVFDKLFISTQDDFVFIEISEIVMIEADGNYSVFKLKSGKQHIASRKIGEFEEMLISHNFYRIHHSYVINMSFVESINKRDNEVTLKGGSRLPISSRKKMGFLDYCQRSLLGS